MDTPEAQKQFINMIQEMGYSRAQQKYILARKELERLCNISNRITYTLISETNHANGSKNVEISKDEEREIQLMNEKIRSLGKLLLVFEQHLITWALEQVKTNPAYQQAHFASDILHLSESEYNHPVAREQMIDFCVRLKPKEVV